jgi:hypothetical protein
MGRNYKYSEQLKLRKDMETNYKYKQAHRRRRSGRMSTLQEALENSEANAID